MARKIFPVFILVSFLAQPSYQADDGSYNYFFMGADWPGLCNNSASIFQTPIDLPYNGSKEIYGSEGYEDMQLIMWQESITQLRLNNGKNYDSVSADLTDGRLAFLDSEDKMNYYQLTNFHIHAPSEHTFDGKYYDMELHMIH